VRELVAHDEERWSMVIESVRSELGGVEGDYAMVMVKIFLRENVVGVLEFGSTVVTRVV
jgi:hypothetical protein